MRKCFPAFISVRLVEAIISLETYRFMSRLTSLATNHWFLHLPANRYLGRVNGLRQNHLNERLLLLETTSRTSMDKKVTTIVGIALGATLAAGFGLYQYFSKKSATTVGMGVAERNGKSIFGDGYIGNSLVKSIGLYAGQTDNGLVGGGLALAGNRTNG